MAVNKQMLTVYFFLGLIPFGAVPCGATGLPFPTIDEVPDRAVAP